MAIQVQGTTVVDDSRKLVNYRRTNVAISANTTANVGVYYVATSNLTLTLPSSPANGDFVAFQTFNANSQNCVIARNGANIMYLAEDLDINQAFATFQLHYLNANIGWVLSV
jgi:hypothetical protein